MNLQSNTILITGGSNGIGLAFAERFLREGNTVIICGRRESKLNEVQKKYPAIHTRVCDVGLDSDRIALFEWATTEFPALNVLMNNAGIQQRMNLTDSPEWNIMREELAINIDAPIHLSTLFIPHLQKQSNAAILNVTSGLSFVPLTRTPVYSATKAALHSFTLSLRWHLAQSSVEVIEIIPPSVQTDLGGVGVHASGTPLDEFADAMFEGLRAGKNEIPYGFSAKSSQASRAELDEIYARMNAR